MEEQNGLTYKGFNIQQDDTGLVCLTDMWRACGSVPSKTPKYWLRQEGVLELIVALMESKGDPGSPLKHRQQRNVSSADGE